VELIIEWFCGADGLGVTPKIASTQGNDDDNANRVGNNDGDDDDRVGDDDDDRVGNDDDNDNRVGHGDNDDGDDDHNIHY